VSGQFRSTERGNRIACKRTGRKRRFGLREMFESELLPEKSEERLFCVRRKRSRERTGTETPEGKTVRCIEKPFGVDDPNTKWQEEGEEDIILKIFQYWRDREREFTLNKSIICRLDDCQ